MLCVERNLLKLIEWAEWSEGEPKMTIMGASKEKKKE